MKTVLIAMSGGVDSSVAAYLLQQQGFRCVGATMRLGSGLQDAQDARCVAERLGIPFYVLDMQADFDRLVKDDFVRSYEGGFTPNPCIQCNRRLKFGLLLEKAQEMGCDYIATGHYARISQDEGTGRYRLQKALDSAKDQSYFLYGLTQEQLACTLFPLGTLTKAKIREIAQAQGFLNARKRDSQDICFVPDGDYMEFLRSYTGREYPAGDFLDLQGRVIGRHKGAVAYTLGQRKGLGLAMGEPVYVCSKDMHSNSVTVGPETALFHRTLVATDFVWGAISCPGQALRVLAKARSRMTEQPATAYPEADGSVRVEFDQPQRALTPGQAIVLYCGDTVAGGGTVSRVL